MKILQFFVAGLLKTQTISCLIYNLNKFKSEFTIGKSVLDKQLVSGFLEIKEETFNRKEADQKYIYDLLVYCCGRILVSVEFWIGFLAKKIKF